MKENVLITGATGYIGSKLTRKLLELDYEVGILIREGSKLDLIKDVIDKIHVFRIDINYENINVIVKKFNPVITFHLASLFINEHKTEQVRDLVESNILFGNILLEALVNNESNNFINTGTSWQHFNNEKYNPVNLYAATKQAFEDIVKYYTEARSIRCINLKLFDTYGPDDTRPKIFTLLKKISKNNELLELSAGEQELDIVYIDDVVNAFILCMNELLFTDESFKYKMYGVGSKLPKSLRQWIFEFETAIGKKLNIVFGKKPYRKREVMETWKEFDKIPHLELSQSFFNKGIK